MKNLWLFLVRYNAFFLFILFFVFSIVLVVRNNNYQRASFINSSNTVVGSYFKQINSWKAYLDLAGDNQKLLEENALLRKKLQGFLAIDTTTQVQLVDSIEKDRYDFTVATVVNNSIHQKNNYITLDKGSADGIHANMGVITSNGVVGIVENVSKNFSTVRSLLHPDIRISVSLDSVSDAFGSLVWGNNIDSRYAMIREIPNHVKAYVGQPIFTSGYSTLFPRGIKVGHVVEPEVVSGDSFKEIRILLSTNFAKLHHVYIVKDKLAQEKVSLEELNKDNEQ